MKRLDQANQVSALLKLARKANSRAESKSPNTPEWKLVSDLENNPHLFLLACIAMRQVKAEIAWAIPLHIKKTVGSVAFSKLLALNERQWQNILKGTGHRYYKQLARDYPLALQKIKSEYQSRADNVWNGTPSSITVMIRLRDFSGVGPKIASMTLDILVRNFDVVLKDYSALDIAADVHVRRVMHRLGLIPRSDWNDLAIWKAREMNPKYPAIFDSLFWNVGRDFCHPTKPECPSCPLNKLCEFATSTS
jgi:endonuclease III